MAATMEATISNLRQLSASDYEMVSTLIERLAPTDGQNASDEDVARALKDVNAQYADTFKVLAQ